MIFGPFRNTNGNHDFPPLPLPLLLYIPTCRKLDMGELRLCSPDQLATQTEELLLGNPGKSIHRGTP